MMELDNLKKDVEKLSEKQQEIIKLSKEVADIAEDSNIEYLNELPLLYKMQLKKALGNAGNQSLAKRIKREGGFDF